MVSHIQKWFYYSWFWLPNQLKYATKIHFAYNLLDTNIKLIAYSVALPYTFQAVEVEELLVNERKKKPIHHQERGKTV